MRKIVVMLIMFGMIVIDQIFVNVVSSAVYNMGSITYNGMSYKEFIYHLNRYNLIKSITVHEEAGNAPSIKVALVNGVNLYLWTKTNDANPQVVKPQDVDNIPCHICVLRVSVENVNSDNPFDHKEALDRAVKTATNILVVLGHNSLSTKTLLEDYYANLYYASLTDSYVWMKPYVLEYPPTVNNVFLTVANMKNGTKDLLFVAIK